MFKSNNFQRYLDIVLLILKVRDQEFKSQIHDESLVNALKSFINFNKEFPKMKEILNKFQLGQQITDLVPESRLNYQYSNQYWFSPVLFMKITNVDVLIGLLSACLLERSIIAYSKNVTDFSYVILGLEQLIRPFQWTTALVPVLPSFMLPVLEAPVPILAGVSENQL